MTTLMRTLFFALLTLLLLGCKETKNPKHEQDNTNVDLFTILNETRTTQYFLDDNVSLKDMTAIIEAGKSAMSGRNSQSWYFGAIINPDIIKEIAGDSKKGDSPHKGAGKAPGRTPKSGPANSSYPKAQLADAPSAIALASNKNNAFSAGLACENMIIAATALGYGAKIVGGRSAQLFNTAENRMRLNIPEEMTVIAVLLVGVPDTTVDMTIDGVTGASDRKPLHEVSTILE